MCDRQWDLHASILSNSGPCRLHYIQEKELLQNILDQLSLNKIGKMLHNWQWTDFLFGMKSTVIWSQGMCCWLTPNCSLLGSSHIWMAKHLLSLANWQSENPSRNRKTFFYKVYYSWFKKEHLNSSIFFPLLKWNICEIAVQFPRRFSVQFDFFWLCIFSSVWASKNVFIFTVRQDKIVVMFYELLFKFSCIRKGQSNHSSYCFSASPKA